MTCRHEKTSGPRRRGFTLIEVMLALAVTGIIATGVTSMLFAISHATADQGNARRQALKLTIIRNRLNESVRGSQGFLATAPGVLVLWMSDTDGSQSPNLGELRRIEFNAATGELSCYQPIANLAPADNLEYTVDADFLAITAALKSSDKFTRTLWATGVASWTVQLNQPDPHDARLVNYQFLLSGANDPMIGAVAPGGQ